MLAIIRIITLFVYFIGINIVLFLIYLTRPFHRNNVYLAGQFYSTMVRILGLKIELRVSNKIDSKQNYVFVANHQNSYDILTISKAALPGVVTVGKKSIKWIPWFFPEGTRSYGRGLLPFKTGAFRLALAANKAIVPVCASEMHNKIKFNRWNNGTVIIEVMEPIDLPEEMNAKQLAQHVHSIMSAKIAQLNIEAEKLDNA